MVVRWRVRDGLDSGVRRKTTFRAMCCDFVIYTCMKQASRSAAPTRMDNQLKVVRKDLCDPRI